MRRLAMTALAGAALAIGSACASAQQGGYVWVDDYHPPPPTARAGTIRSGDLVDVRVLGQDQLSAKVRVRADGNITMPFLNDVQAAGQTPAALGSQIERRLKAYVNAPVVTVVIEESAPAPVSVVGEVAKPGKYPIEPGMGVLDALALAGGLTEYARKDRVYVLRGSPTPTRIRFDSRRLLRGEGRGLGFTLEAGDVVVAE